MSKIKIPHYGIRRKDNKAIMMTGGGDYITSPNRELMEIHLEKSSLKDEIEIVEFSPTTVDIIPDKK